MDVEDSGDGGEEETVVRRGRGMGGRAETKTKNEVEKEAGGSLNGITRTPLFFF